MIIYISIVGPKGDPCSKLSCPPYATCKASFDGNSASCHCPDSCVSNQLSQDTVVCGKFKRHFHEHEIQNEELYIILSFQSNLQKN